MSAFIHPGRFKAFWVDTIANINAPSAAEINAGTALHGRMRGTPNIPRTGNVAEANDLSTYQEKRQAGTVGGDNITYEIKRDTGTETEYAAVAERDEGYFVVFRKGTAGASPAAADVCSVYPSQCISISDGTPGRNDVDFAIVELSVTDVIARDVAVVV